MNDAGTFFTDRMVARTSGDTGVIVWRAGYGLDATQSGLDVVRVGGRWKLSMKSFTSGDGPETVRDVLDGIGDANAYTRRLEKVVSDIESGKLRTFEEINSAM